MFCALASKIPSLARPVPKSCVGDAEVLQTCEYHRCRPPTCWLCTLMRYAERDAV